MIAGLSAGAIVIPQAMAYATIAGLPVQVGLYTCLVPALGYVLLGGSRALSFTTTSTIAVLTATTLHGAAPPGGPDAGDLATLVFLVAGVLLAARVLRLAAVVENVSDALLTGLKLGVGLTVMVSQAPKLLGVPAKTGSVNFVSGLAYLVTHVPDTRALTAIVGLGGLAVLLLLKRFAGRLPGPLFLVAVSIVAAYAAHLAEHGVPLIAGVPAGLPPPVMPSFQHTAELLPGAVAIAMMAFLETVSVARTIRASGEPVIDNGQELLAAGVAALAGAFFRAMPPAGGFSQSAVSRSAGARTQLSQLTTIVLAVLTALLLGPVISHLPQATLGALVVAAVAGLISVRELTTLARFSLPEFGVAIGTATVALFAGLLVSVAVGVGLTVLLILHELNRVPVTVLGVRADGRIVPGGEPVDGLLIVRLGAPLYTANVRTATHRVAACVAAAGEPVQVVIVEATAVGMLSLTILSAMRDAERELAEQGIALWVAALPERALRMARKTPGWAEWHAAGRLWPTTDEAVDEYRRRYQALRE